MAKFSAELLKSLIDLRLKDQKTKEKCLQEGLASLENVIKSAIENLNDLLESVIERNILSNTYASAFLHSQDTYQEVRYDQPLSENNINKYIELYILNIASLVNKKLEFKSDKWPSLETEIDLKIINDRIQECLNNPDTIRSVFERGRSKLETVLLWGVEYYYEHLKGDNAINYLSDLRYQAIYFARLNCRDIIPGTPLTKETSSRFIYAFLNALINVSYSSCLKSRLG